MMRRRGQAMAVLLAIGLVGCATAPGKQAPSLLMEDVRILAADDMGGRPPGTPESAKARAYLLSRLRQIGIEPFGAAFEQPFSFERNGKAVQGVNLVGRVKGTGRSDRVLVVMAHYDHLGVEKGEIHNGADDNASGVAVLLAVAQEMKARRPRHDVIFALVDAEESGSRGARAFVASPPVPLPSIALAVNLDMLSKNNRNELYAAGAHHFPWLKPRLEALAKAAPVSLKQGHDSPEWGENDWTQQSDHRAFHEKGVPWVYFGVEDHPEYHKPTDDFATVPEDFFRRSAQTVVMAVRTFDRDLDAIAAEARR